MSIEHEIVTNGAQVIESNKVIHIYHQPMGLGDQFSDEMMAALTKKELRVRTYWLWPPRLSHGLCGGAVPRCLRPHRIHDVLVTFWHYKYLRSVKNGDVVIIDGSSKASIDMECWLERRILKRGASYVLYFVDDHFVSPARSDSLVKRVNMASALVAVTPQLKSRLEALFPDKLILLLEEPIDPDRVGLVEYPDETDRVSVAWTGRMLRAKNLANAVETSKRQSDFNFRVVTGRHRPQMDFPFEWEWRPFSRDCESVAFKGCVAGVCNLEDTVYDACKGNYKVKTYMAMGLCPIVSNVGYARDLIENGVTGLLVSSDQEWVDAINYVVNNPMKAIEMGRRARSFILNTYAAQPLANAWAGQLQRLL